LFELWVVALEFVAEIALQLAFEWLGGTGVRGLRDARDARQARREKPLAREVSPALAMLG
jgi:hypothetical protein